jgi:hypothetical protein
MAGMVFVTGLLFGATFIGLRSRGNATRPGLGMVLAVAVASCWYLFS